MILHRIQEAVEARVGEIAATREGWPCRKGCDECCRALASEPRVSREEWVLIRAAIQELPAEIAGAVRARMGESAGAERPVTCALLDRDSGSCLVYAARPVACRAYGFYAEREKVLGCRRIEQQAVESTDIVWGNHVALEDSLSALGPARELSAWMNEEV